MVAAQAGNSNYPRIPRIPPVQTMHGSQPGAGMDHAIACALGSNPCQSPQTGRHGPPLVGSAIVRPGRSSAATGRRSSTVGPLVVGPLVVVGPLGMGGPSQYICPQFSWAPVFFVQHIPPPPGEAPPEWTPLNPNHPLDGSEPDRTPPRHCVQGLPDIP